MSLQRSRFELEVVLHTELNVAGSLRTIDDAEIAAKAAVRGIEDRRVRDVDEFTANFEVLLLESGKEFGDAKVDGV